MLQNSIDSFFIKYVSTNGINDNLKSLIKKYGKRQNDGTSKYVIWVSEIGDNTCKVCKSRNGEVYKIENEPELPHPNCKCEKWYFGGEVDESAFIKTDISATLEVMQKHLDEKDKLAKEMVKEREKGNITFTTFGDKFIDYLVKIEQYLRFVDDDGFGNPTVGIGHKVLDGEDFSKGISFNDAVKLLKRDLQEEVDGINSFIIKYNNNLTQKQFDGLLSIRMNSNYKMQNDYSLTQMILLGEADPKKIIIGFTNWSKSKNQKGELVFVPGLYRRRVNDALIFLYGDYSNYEISDLIKMGYWYE